MTNPTVTAAQNSLNSSCSRNVVQIDVAKDKPGQHDKTQRQRKT